MTCRCRSPQEHEDRASQYERETILSIKADADKKIQELKWELSSVSPDNTKFQIEEIKEIGNFLVMKVLFPNCVKCAYEGNKILVYENVKMIDVFKWRVLDPHFRPTVSAPNEAPSPIARFPASKTGWIDACSFVDYRRARNGSQK